MSPRKLTEDDKQEILQLYRDSQATTSTLADRFGVSSSTISRFLKNKLSKSEYEELIQQKRLARTPRGDKSSTAAKKAAEIRDSPSEVVADLSSSQKVKVAEDSASELGTDKTKRRRSSAVAKEVAEKETPVKVIPEPERISAKASDLLVLKSQQVEDDDEDDGVDVAALSEMIGEELIDIEEDEDEDEEDEDEEDNLDDELPYRPAKSGLELEILPLTEAAFPKICYLVIDRAAELIVKPLEDFGDLGSIPETEVRQKTLPIFDNHRIAKRFSHRRERVIKVPDGKMFQKTSHQLQAKGITRLLFDGQIYAL
ncbi:helix-turn-helix domain-containing protein [Myxosarcina sp. GI1(2024)]